MSRNWSVSLKVVAREVAECKLYLLGVEKARWGKDDIEPAHKHIFLCWKMESSLGDGLYSK